jgi:hypothetical protein
MIPPVSHADYQAAIAAGQISTDTPLTEYASLIRSGAIERPGARLTPPAMPVSSSTPPIQRTVGRVGGESLPIRAYSSEIAPETQIGVGIPREPPRLVLLPDEVAAAEQTRRAYTPSAREQGLKAAARVPRGELEASLRAQHLSEEHIAQIMRTVFGTP